MSETKFKNLKTNTPGFCVSSMLLLCLLALTFNSCGKRDNALVINEVMASNHSGLTAGDGQPHDWIELKNTTGKSANLKDYALALVKEKDNSKKDNKKKKDKKGKKKDKNGKKDEKNVWQLPDRKIKPGECVLIWASKSDEGAKGELHAPFKLPSKGAKIALLLHGDTVQTLTYPELEDDQCYRRLADSTYEKSYEPTPGFDNNDKGYEQYNTALDKQRQGPLRLWELHSKGRKVDAAWVELKNVSSQPVDLHDYYLTTSTKDPREWQLPQVQLQPGATYVVRSQKGGFKISGHKSVTLTRDDHFVDGLCGGAAPFGVSVGRVQGLNGIFYFDHPTPGAENTTTHYRHLAPQPEFVTKPGVYAGKKVLNVRLNGHGHAIRYTTNGSAPTANAATCPDSFAISKTTVVRAYCEGDSTTLRSPEVLGTYIFDASHSIAVMNVTVSHSDLYDYNNGIYALGPDASPAYPHVGANYWKPWWKTAHVEFYDPEGPGFSTGCQLAIFGGFSRALDKKSFKIRFRDNLGVNKMNYDLYGDGEPFKFKNFVLRSGSQDIRGVMVRDEFFTSLMQERCPELLIQKYRPVALYVNGEYFGLYYLREKIDEDFVARKLHVSDNDISIVMSLYSEEGSMQGYNQLMNFITTHDMAQSKNYKQVCQQLDVQGLIDYKLGTIYSSNTDVGNVRFVYSPDPKGDQKWHYVFYDIDASWETMKPASFFLRTNFDNELNRTMNLWVDRLLRNSDFRQLFLERLSLHLHTTFEPTHATSVFNRLIDTIRPEMKRNCDRWAQVMTYSDWERNVKSFRSKFKDRPKVMLSQLRQELNINAQENKKYFADLGY